MTHTVYTIDIEGYDPFVTYDAAGAKVWSEQFDARVTAETWSPV